MFDPLLWIPACGPPGPWETWARWEGRSPMMREELLRFASTAPARRGRRRVVRALPLRAVAGILLALDPLDGRLCLASGAVEVLQQWIAQRDRHP